MFNVDVSTLSHLLLDKAHGKQQMTVYNFMLGAPGSALRGLYHCFSRIFHLSLGLARNCSVELDVGDLKLFTAHLKRKGTCFGPCRVEAPKERAKMQSHRSIFLFYVELRTLFERASSLRGRSLCALSLLLAACLQGTEAGAQNQTC